MKSSKNIKTFKITKEKLVNLVVYLFKHHSLFFKETLEKRKQSKQLISVANINLLKSQVNVTIFLSFFSSVIAQVYFYMYFIWHEFYICAIMIISGFSTFAATKRKKLSNVLCGLWLFGHCEINCLFLQR